MADHKHDHPGHRGLRAATGSHLTDLLRAGVSVVLGWSANTATSRAWIRSVFEAAAASHARHAAVMDWDHRDPWDRILAAQARLEGCSLISVDRAFDAIGLERI